MVHKMEVPKMTSGRAALVELIQRYLNGVLDPFISLLELHKLIFFMQESGEPLRLKYRNAYYGPYAENLLYMFNAIEGHVISSYSDGGDMPDKQLVMVPGVAVEAKAFLEQQEDTYRHFQKVSELVEGF